MNDKEQAEAIARMTRKISINEGVQNILNYFHKNPSIRPTWFDIEGKCGTVHADTSSTLREAISKMQATGMLKDNINLSYYHLDKLGYEINEMGTYEDYLKRQRDKNSLIRKQNKWFWYAAALAIASGLLSLTGILLSKTQQQLAKDRLDKMELQLQQMQKGPSLNQPSLNNSTQPPPTNTK